VGSRTRFARPGFVPTRAASIAAVRATVVARPFPLTSWRTVVRVGRIRRASGFFVEADHREVVGHPQPQLLGGPHHPVCHHVGEAQHRGRPVRELEHLADGARHDVLWPLGLDRGPVGRAHRLADHHRLDAGCAQRVGPAQHPLVRHVQLAGQRGGPQRRVGLELAGHDADPAVPEVDEVLGGGPGPAAVVDVAAGDAGHRHLVDVHHGEPPAREPLDRVGVEPARVDQGTVHRDVPRLHVLAAPDPLVPSTLSKIPTTA